MSSRVTVWVIALVCSGLMMALLLVSAAHAQDAAGSWPVGSWHGAIHLPTGDHRLAVEITGKPGAYTGTVRSPEVTDRDAPLDSVTVADGKLHFTLDSIKASFSGRWDAASSSWVGAWTQGQDYPVTLAGGKLEPRPTIVGLDGTWEGAVEAPGGLKLRIVLRIHTSDSGTIVLMDSPDQAATGIPIPVLAREGQKVSFEIPIARASYAGVLGPDGQTIEGTWTQGAAIPLDLSRTRASSQVAEARRPQTPKPPFPYVAEEVTFDSAPGVRLAGTLTLPPGKGPFPAAVMITGSGAQDRDETIVGHKPFAVWADALTRRGVAVLRWDDRGFAKSTGDFSKATSEDFAADGLAAMAYLRTRHDIDPKRVGVIGHSEGGMVGPMMAARDPRVAFVVMMAGPGAPTRELMAAQREAVSRSMGLPPAMIARNEATQAKLEAVLSEAKPWEEVKTDATKILVDAGMPAAAVPAQLAAVNSVWYKWFIAYDPRPTLAKLRMPVLAANGDKDVQVVSKQNIPAIREALKANRDATVVELPGLNHLFQTARTGSPAEYAAIEETIAPAALDLMVDWVVKHTRR
jgi:pimeloyl-ACP methyl ester carboxylesterase